MIKVSVVIPVYNVEKYLEECLNHVLKQTLQEIEVICIDDGSTDSSLRILKQYAQVDHRIRILQQNHKGGGAARNLGLEEAKGEYLSFLDADDFFDLKMLEKSYVKAKENNADVLIFGVKCYHQATGAITDEPSGLREELLPDKTVFNWRDIPQYIFNIFHNWPWNKLFKRSFVQNNQIRFQEIHRTNDLLFVNKALILAERIVALPEKLVFYRVQTSGNCQSRNESYPFDFCKAFMALKQFIEQCGIYAEVELSFKNHFLDACCANLRSLEFGISHKQLFIELKSSIYKQFELRNFSIDSVYSYYLEAYHMFCLILESDYETFLMKRADWYREHYVQGLFEDYRKNTRICELEKQVSDCQEKEDILQYELKCVYNSISFRTGRLLTWIPRKIRVLVKHEE